MPKFSGISGTNSKLSSVPSLIVFDLDNTLWTPELYQLRKLERNNIEPVAHKDVQLFPAAKEIIETLKRDEKYSKTKFAVASRTKSVSWAHSLLKQFDLYDFFHFIEIFPGDKQNTS
jgi:magnesium-dependent phosphatase 1